MIKNKKDVVELVDGLKNGNTLNYKTDTTILFFKYDNNTCHFIVHSESNISRIKSIGTMTYDVIVHQIWLDRKYINNFIK